MHAWTTQPIDMDEHTFKVASLWFANSSINIKADEV